MNIYKHSPHQLGMKLTQMFPSFFGPRRIYKMAMAYLRLMHNTKLQQHDESIKLKCNRIEGYFCNFLARLTRLGAFVKSAFCSVCQLQHHVRSSTGMKIRPHQTTLCGKAIVSDDYCWFVDMLGKRRTRIQ